MSHATADEPPQRQRKTRVMRWAAPTFVERKKRDALPKDRPPPARKRVAGRRSDDCIQFSPVLSKSQVSGPASDAQGVFAKCSPGSSGPAPGTLKVKCVSSLHVTSPTIGTPLSCASVKSPFPAVSLPWINRS